MTKLRPLDSREISGDATSPLAPSSARGFQRVTAAILGPSQAHAAVLTALTVKSGFRGDKLIIDSVRRSFVSFSKHRTSNENISFQGDQCSLNYSNHTQGSGRTSDLVKVTAVGMYLVSRNCLTSLTSPRDIM